MAKRNRRTQRRNRNRRRGAALYTALLAHVAQHCPTCHPNRPQVAGHPKGLKGNGLVALYYAYLAHAHTHHNGTPPLFAACHGAAYWVGGEGVPCPNHGGHYGHYYYPHPAFAGQGGLVHPPWVYTAPVPG
jgi:hypothetical protein